MKRLRDKMLDGHGYGSDSGYGDGNGYGYGDGYGYEVPSGLYLDEEYETS